MAGSYAPGSAELHEYLRALGEDPREPYLYFVRVVGLTYDYAVGRWYGRDFDHRATPQGLQRLFKSLCKVLDDPHSIPLRIVSAVTIRRDSTKSALPRLVEISTRRWDLHVLKSTWIDEENLLLRTEEETLHCVQKDAVRYATNTLRGVVLLANE